MPWNLRYSSDSWHDIDFVKKQLYWQLEYNWYTGKLLVQLTKRTISFSGLPFGRWARCVLPDVRKPQEKDPGIFILVSTDECSPDEKTTDEQKAITWKELPQSYRKAHWGTQSEWKCLWGSSYLQCSKVFKKNIEDKVKKRLCML